MKTDLTAQASGMANENRRCPLRSSRRYTVDNNFLSTGAPIAARTLDLMNAEFQNAPPIDAFQARQWIADLGAQLTQRDLLFRDPPEEPGSCCGRGCNGCVWEGYLNAVGYWCAQVREILVRE